MRQIGSGTCIRAIAAILAVTALAVPAMAQTERDPERYGHELRSVLPGFLFHARDASWIGVAIDDIGNGDGGATVTDITDGSPAARAGLHEGDVVVRFDGERIRSGRHLARVVRETPIGREVMIDVVRDGDHETLTLTTAEHPAARRQAWRFIRPDGALNLENLDRRLGDLSERLEHLPLPEFVGDGDFLLRLESAPSRLGIRVRAIDGQLATYFVVERGLLVQHVEPSTPAAEADLRAGDVITSIDGATLGRASQLRRHLHRVDPGAAVTLDIVRDGAPRSIRVTLPDAGR